MFLWPAVAFVAELRIFLDGSYYETALDLSNALCSTDLRGDLLSRKILVYNLNQRLHMPFTDRCYEKLSIVNELGPLVVMEPVHKPTVEAEEYIKKMTPEQKKIHELAIKMLGSSYFVERARGFEDFKAKQGK